MTTGETEIGHRDGALSNLPLNLLAIELPPSRVPSWITR